MKLNARIVIEVPEKLKKVVGPVRDLLSALEASVCGMRGGRAVDYAVVERELGERICAIERASHETLLGELDLDAPSVEIKGKRFSRVGRSNGVYYTMAGPVEIKRALYREDGCRNARTVDAISLRSGAIGHGWLPQTATAMAHLLQQGTSREAEQTARTLGRLPYSRASFERVPHELAVPYLEQQADIEDELIQELKIPEEARSASIALDRVSVPIAEPVKRPVGRPRKDAPRNPVSREFRMAYCGTLTFHDADGESLQTIRYACMPNADAERLCERMATDLKRVLDGRPDLRVSALADGAPEMWRLLRCVSALGINATELVDFWHLVEKLHAAAVVIYGEEQAADVLARWKRMLRESPKAVGWILTRLEASGCEDKRSDGRRPVHDAITYLRNNGHRMDYATARQQNLPIGSGNVEATCKTLVGQRMKRCGSRWKEPTGEHVLQLRALALSDRFQPAMDKFFATRRTAVRAAA